MFGYEYIHKLLLANTTTGSKCSEELVHQRSLIGLFAFPQNIFLAGIDLYHHLRVATFGSHNINHC